MDQTEEFYKTSQTVDTLQTVCKNKNTKLVLPKKILRSKIVFVGESLGETEHRKEDYFVGNSGIRLDLIFSKVKLLRQLVHITNLVKVRPPDNKMKRLPELGLEVADFLPMLKEELEFIKPNIIVALGGSALYHLTGQYEVTKYRGSVLPCTLVPGLKVIGAFHPSYAHRNPELNFTMVFDFKKAIEQSEFPEIRTKPWIRHINPSFEEVTKFLIRCLDVKHICYDVETAGFRNTRLGIALSDEEGISIPLKIKNMQNAWTDNELDQILQHFKRVWKKVGILKIAQNQEWDLHYLVPLLGFPASPMFDTLQAHKLLFSVGDDSRLAVPHDLGFIMSTCTDMPYHKDDSKDWKLKYIPSDDTLSKYNVDDVIGTYRSAMTLMKQLNDRKLTNLFCGYTMPLRRVLFQMEYEGCKTDNVKRAKMYRLAQKASRQLQKKIDRDAGRELNVNSFKQVSTLLYEEMKLPVKKKRTTGKKTTDDKALTELYRSPTVTKTQKPILKMILKQRTLTSKILGNYLNKDKLSKICRLHTSYGETASGRLASSENKAIGHGNNLQNFPEIARDFVVPENGNVFLSPDLSQAEALYMMYESNAKELKHECVVKKRKIHNVLGEWVFEKEEQHLTTREYDIAKRLVHATNYRMGPLTFARNANITMAQARFFQTKYLTVFSELLGCQNRIIAEGKKTRQVTTIYGATRWFLGRLNETTAKEMVSHKPQSIVAYTLNFGLLSLFMIAPPDVKMKIQIHDEIMQEMPPSRVEEFRHYNKIHMEILRAMMIKGDVLCIPVSIPEPRFSWMKPK